MCHFIAGVRCVFSFVSRRKIHPEVAGMQVHFLFSPFMTTIIGWLSYHLHFIPMYRMDEEEEERVGNETAWLRHRQMCHPAAAGRAPLMDPPGNSLRARRGCKTKLKHKALLAIIVYFNSFRHVLTIILCSRDGER